MSLHSEYQAPPQGGRRFSRRLHRRAPGVIVLLLSVTLLAGCATTPRTSVLHTGDPVVDGKAELAVARPQDRVMWNYRIAASALRAGNFEEAKARLDEAILNMGGIINNDADAARARGLFSGEDRKIFIGEPYERVMAFYYRGLLYWRDGQPDNARACFRTAQFIDGDAEAASYRSDYVLLDYLDGFASEKLSADGSDALKRAKVNAQSRELPDYDRRANVLVFAEYGAGPRKYAGGEYGEQLRFMVGDSPAHSATLTVDGREVPLPPYDDLNYQATTRGGRVMDHILGNKAVFKSTTNTVGDVALIGGAVAAGNIRRYDGSKNHDAESAAIALGAIGLISKIASAATTPNADTRMWHNLPQRLSFAALRLPVGQHTATLEFFDRAGSKLAGMTRELTIVVDDDTRDTVVFLSELKR
jgi:tetratricopeptide (TPR) repeat protein